MSKNNKNSAKFKLTADGFSIHTLELFQTVTYFEYWKIRDFLFSLNTPGNPVTYMDHDYCRSKYWQRNGIHIHLENSNGYYIRLRINPRLVIAPESSYLGILPPTKESLVLFQTKFKELFAGTPINGKINEYRLTRLDQCCNVYCNNAKVFRETVRVLRKLPAASGYDRVFYKDKRDKKAESSYNKHYLRFEHWAHTVVIYDKTYQMCEEGLTLAYEKLPEGVLRFEASYSKKYLQKRSKECGSTLALLEQLIYNSREDMISAFSDCFPDDVFCQFEEIERRVNASSYHKETRERMIELSNRLRRTQSVDKALKKMEKDGYRTEGVLERFAELGISPIPLWDSFCAATIPSPVTLLHDVADGTVRIALNEI